MQAENVADVNQNRQQHVLDWLENKAAKASSGPKNLNGTPMAGNPGGGPAMAGMPTIPAGRYYCRACERFCGNTLSFWTDHLTGKRHKKVLAGKKAELGEEKFNELYGDLVLKVQPPPSGWPNQGRNRPTVTPQSQIRPFDVRATKAGLEGFLQSSLKQEAAQRASAVTPGLNKGQNMGLRSPGYNQDAPRKEQSLPVQGTTMDYYNSGRTGEGYSGWQGGVQHPKGILKNSTTKQPDRQDGMSGVRPHQGNQTQGFESKTNSVNWSYCELCGIHLSSEEAFRLHCNGMLHKQKLKDLVAIPPKLPTVVARPTVLEYVFTLKLCGKTTVGDFEAFKGHLVSKPHCELLENKRKILGDENLNQLYGHLFLDRAILREKERVRQEAAMIAKAAADREKQERLEIERQGRERQRQMAEGSGPNIDWPPNQDRKPDHLDTGHIDNRLVENRPFDNRPMDDNMTGFGQPDMRPIDYQAMDSRSGGYSGTYPPGPPSKPVVPQKIIYDYTSITHRGMQDDVLIPGLDLIERPQSTSVEGNRSPALAERSYGATESSGSIFFGSNERGRYESVRSTDPPPGGYNIHPEQDRGQHVRPLEPDRDRYNRLQDHGRSGGINTHESQSLQEHTGPGHYGHPRSPERPRETYGQQQSESERLRDASSKSAEREMFGTQGFSDRQRDIPSRPREPTRYGGLRSPERDQHWSSRSPERNRNRSPLSPRRDLYRSSGSPERYGRDNSPGLSRQDQYGSTRPSDRYRERSPFSSRQNWYQSSGSPEQFRNRSPLSPRRNSYGDGHSTDRNRRTSVEQDRYRSYKSPKSARKMTEMYEELSPDHEIPSPGLQYSSFSDSSFEEMDSMSPNSRKTPRKRSGNARDTSGDAKRSRYQSPTKKDNSSGNESHDAEIALEKAKKERDAALETARRLDRELELAKVKFEEKEAARLKAASETARRLDAELKLAEKRYKAKIEAVKSAGKTDGGEENNPNVTDAADKQGTGQSQGKSGFRDLSAEQLDHEHMKDKQGEKEHVKRPEESKAKLKEYESSQQSNLKKSLQKMETDKKDNKQHKSDRKERTQGTIHEHDSRLKGSRSRSDKSSDRYDGRRGDSRDRRQSSVWSRDRDLSRKESDRDRSRRDSDRGNNRQNRSGSRASSYSGRDGSKRESERSRRNNKTDLDRDRSKRPDKDKKDYKKDNIDSKASIKKKETSLNEKSKDLEGKQDPIQEPSRDDKEEEEEEFMGFPDLEDGDWEVISQAGSDEEVEKSEGVEKSEVGNEAKEESGDEGPADLPASVQRNLLEVLSQNLKKGSAGKSKKASIKSLIEVLSQQLKEDDDDDEEEEEEEDETITRTTTIPSIKKDEMGKECPSQDVKQDPYQAPEHHTSGQSSAEVQSAKDTKQSLQGSANNQKPGSDSGFSSVKHDKPQPKKEKEPVAAKKNVSKSDVETISMLREAHDCLSDLMNNPEIQQQQEVIRQSENPYGHLSVEGQDLALQVAEKTGISDPAVVLSALELLQRLDTGLIHALGSLDPEVIQMLSSGEVQLDELEKFMDPEMVAQISASGMAPGDLMMLFGGGGGGGSSGDQNSDHKGKPISTSIGRIGKSDPRVKRAKKQKVPKWWARFQKAFQDEPRDGPFHVPGPNGGPFEGPGPFQQGMSNQGPYQGPGPNQGPFQGPGPNQPPFGGPNPGHFHGPNQGPFHGPSPGQFQGHGPNQGQFQGCGPNQGPFGGPNHGPGPNDGTFQGSMPDNRPFPGSGPNQGPFQGPGANQGSFQGPGPNQGSFQGPGPNQEAFQGAGPNQGPFQGARPNQGPFQGSGPNQGPFQGPGPNQGPFQGPGPNQGPFQGPGPNQGPFQGPGPNQGPFHGPGPNQGQFQGPSQGPGPGPMDSPFQGPGPGFPGSFGGGPGPGPNNGGPFRGPSPGCSERPHMGPDGGGGKRMSNKENKKKCFNCGEKGHIQSDCPMLSSMDVQEKMRQTKCFNCLEMGHFARDCPRPKQSK